MRIVVHHTKFFEWVPLPDDVTFTAQDVSAGKVRMGGRDGKRPEAKSVLEPKGGTHTQIALPEREIHEKIIHEMARLEGGRIWTRTQAIEAYLRENTLPHHTAHQWMTNIEVHDDQSEIDGDALRALIEPHTKSENPKTGRMNIDPDLVDEMVAAYLTPHTSDELVLHLHKQFRVKGKPTVTVPATDPKGGA